jgi:predicted nuclease of predicted toxin-antitoxin system
MRVLLDECLPRTLARDFVGHEAQTVPQAGWAGKSNGELLTLAETAFDVFVTIDRALASTERMEGRKIAVVVLSAPRNSAAVLRPLVPRVLEALRTISPGQLVSVSSA